MSFIRLWIQGIASAAVAGCIAVMLSPEGKLGKGVKTAVSLFMICSFLLPAVKGNADFSEFEKIYSSGNEEYAESYTESAAKELERELKTTCSNILDENGINYKDIIIYIKTDENTVDVKSIEVISDCPDKQKISKIIESKTGIPAAVKTENIR